MDDSSNVTYVTLEGFVELHRYRHLCFVIMFILYVLIICCNLIIVCLIVIHRNLHQPMYIFIAALLMNSVVFSTNIYPKLLLDFLSDKQIISHMLCVFQAFIYYSINASEILLLAAMSYDRYVSICKPLQYPTIMRKTTVSVFLVLAWTVPALMMVASVVLNAKIKLCNFILKRLFCNNSLYKLQCLTSAALTIYGMYLLLNLMIVPLLFILFSYTRILVVAYRSCKSVRRKAANTCLPHLLVLISFSCFFVYDVVIVKLESDIPATSNVIMTLQMILYHPLLNPLIYGLKMKEISKHLKRLFQLKSQ